MEYEEFAKAVKGFIERAGMGVSARFHMDLSRGLYYAVCPDDIVISGNRDCRKLTISWNGGNHRSMVCV